MEEKSKILVVDDDFGIGEMLKTLLEFYGFEVIVTDKPDETKELIINENIDLVLLDMLISGINGAEVCLELKNDEVTGNIPVIMMSALHDAGPQCKKAGANDFISKPFEMEELISKINEVLRQNRN